MQAKALRRRRRPLVRVYVQTPGGWASMDVDASLEPPRVIATGIGRTKADAREALQSDGPA